jgi:hypothetical protein
MAEPADYWLQGLQVGNTWAAQRSRNRESQDRRDMAQTELAARFGDDTVFGKDGKVDVFGSAAKKRIREEARIRAEAEGTLRAWDDSPIGPKQAQPAPAAPKFTPLEPGDPGMSGSQMMPSADDFPMGPPPAAAPVAGVAAPVAAPTNRLQIPEEIAGNPYALGAFARQREQVAQEQRYREQAKALSEYRNDQEEIRKAQLKIREDVDKRAAAAAEKANIPLTEKPLIPLKLPDGTVSGYGYQGAAGSIHQVFPAKGSAPATPASAASLIKAIDGEIAANDPSLTPERKANLIAQRQQAVDFIKSKVMPEFQPLVPQVVTNQTLGGFGPNRVSTNFVPAQVAPAPVTTAKPASAPTARPAPKVGDTVKQNGKLYRITETGPKEL